MKENIILLGIMGCGKTTLGRKLSRVFSYECLDTDEQIEQITGQEISEIFRTQGEEVFRELETKVLSSLQELSKRMVISVGGGLPLREKNRKLLAKLGYVVWLKSDAETIYERLKDDTTRPLLAVMDPKKKIEELIEERNPYYASVADCIIEIKGRSFYSIISEIEEIMKKRRLSGRKSKMQRKKKILILNGPNINFLGKREPEIYGTKTYDDLLSLLFQKANSLGIELKCYQSNVEGELIDSIQDSCESDVDGVIINPAAYTHSSYAIHDALLSLKVPVIEVHLSNIHKREEFRRVSVTAPACTGQITGLGFQGYLLAMEAILQMQ